MKKTENIVSRVREFNRFYTVFMGTLNYQTLDSNYSVTESRILFELFSNENVTANFLAEQLHLDKSYISRLLKNFERHKLISKKTSLEDKRSFNLFLTEKGTLITIELIKNTNQQIEELILPLNKTNKKKLVAAMDTITQLLKSID